MKNLQLIYSIVKTKKSPLRSGTRQMLTTAVHHCTRDLVRVVKQEKEIESIQIENEVVKLSVFSDDMIYIENPIEFIKKVLELINSAKVVGARSKHKNQLCFYTPSKNEPKEN